MIDGLAIEQRRLAILQSLNVLDTPIEERFERITRLVCRILGVPMAAISFVDAKRVWFKSIQGFDLREIPRDVSFCSQAIQSDSSLVIEDVLSDPRFLKSPLVAPPINTRFYVGFPINIICGERLGTLCIFDTVSHSLNQEDKQFLADMAETVASELKAYSLKAY